MFSSKLYKNTLSAAFLWVVSVGCENAAPPEAVVLPEKNISHPEPNPGDGSSGGGSSSNDDLGVPLDPVMQDVVYSQGYSVAPLERKIDLLFVVDNSGSMDGEQTILADSFRNFISSFQNRGLSYRIGVTTTDMRSTSLPGFQSNGPGSLVSYGTNDRILSPDSLDIVTQFMQNVKVGIRGDGGEMGIAAATSALSTERLSGWNANFIRQDAFLSVIVVSDEDESRLAGQQAYIRDFPAEKAERLARFESTLSSLKGAQLNNVRVDAVIRPAGVACSTGLGVGLTYAEVATRYRGKVINICEVFSGQIEDLGAEIAVQVQSQFTIPRAIDALRKVSLNGQPLRSPEEYTYDAATNTVHIVGAALDILEQGASTVEIEYMVRELR